MKPFEKLIAGLGVLAITASVALTACSKSANQAEVSDEVSIYLTDDAGPFDNVFVDIRYVEVKVQEGYENREHEGDKEDDDDDHFDDNDKDGDNDNKSKDQFGKWDTLSIRPGVYDILKLRNGVDTLFAKGRVKGRVRKIRLTLGRENSVVLAGTTYPVLLHPAVNNYVYIRTLNRHHENIGAKHIGFWVDFDVSSSIIKDGNRFYLRPLIKPFCEKQFGKVQGKVVAADMHTFVKMYNAKDSGAAIPEKSGEFKIRGLNEGTYKAKFVGVSATRLVDTTINDIKVVKGKETIIPTVTLRR
jgi:hypothetical protein